MRLKPYIQGLCASSKKLAFTDPNASYQLAEQALTLAKEFKLKSLEGHALFHKAYACRVMSDYANGLTYAFQALDIFEAIGDNEGLYKVHNIIGIVYFYYGAYSDAHEHFMSALDLLSKHQDHNVESSVLNNLGEIYREAADFDQALAYYERALVITMQQNLTFNTAAILLNLGEVEFHRQNYELSTNHVKKAYEIVLANNHILEQGEAESKLGRALRATGDFEAARAYYVMALDKFEKMSNKYYLVDLLIEMAILDEAMGMNPVKNYLEALDASESAGLEKKVVAIYKHFAEYYERKGAFEKALEYFKQYHSKTVEIDATNLSKRLEILSVEFEYYKHKSEHNQFKQLTEKLSREVALTRSELDAIKMNNQSLHRETLIDELTQVYNRRGIEHQLSEWFANSPTFEGAVFLMDIDYFKKYNDQWGHIKGDHCLREVASAIGELTSDDCFIGRYGGDEFIAVAKVDSYEEALAVGERIRNSVAHIGDMDKVTLSVGGYFGKVTHNDIWTKIEHADTHLYQAKESGRNNLVVGGTGCEH